MTKRRRPASRFFGAAIVILGVTAATAALGHLGVLDHFETAGLDSFNLMQRVRNPREVVMTGITDTDYQGDLFKGTSPLACASIRRILTAIAAGKPRVIGVDLDTTEGDFACLAGLPPEWPPIVWAQDAIWDDHERAFGLLPVLAGNVTLRTKDRAGVVQFPQDADGVIRRFVRSVPVRGGGEAESFPWMVVKTATTSETPHEDEHDALRLNFAGERFGFSPLSVGSVLTIVEQGDASGWRSNSPLAERIALLGGYYRAARDSYVTPVGPMNGVQIIAQAIESELHHGGIRPLNEWLAILLEILSGVLLVAVHHRLHGRPGRALILSAVLIPVLVLASSLIAFSTLALWFNFVPVVVSVLIHQLWENTFPPRPALPAPPHGT
jgi:CHASE2 domain-containing sensor protein